MSKNTTRLWTLLIPLDTYLAYYRISIWHIIFDSKKYYLRLFFHLLDLAVINSWLLYRRDCDSLAIPRQKRKDQLAFKLALANHLCKHGKSIAGEKRGKLSFNVQLDCASKKKKGPATPIPDIDIRRDEIGHMPVVDVKQRYKLPLCKLQSVFKCIKCQVHLCLNKKSKGFVAFNE